MAGTFLIVILLIAVAWFLLRARFVPSRQVTLRDVSEIVSRLQRSGGNGHFAVLIFVPPDSTDGEPVNLQYSIEGGIIGMDWVLLSPRNVADQEKIKEFASSLGHQLGETEVNKVRYLRVTGGGIVDLGVRIIQDFYKVGPETKLELIPEGFTWPPR
jgi:hypothetical protein